MAEGNGNEGKGRAPAIVAGANVQAFIPRDVNEAKDLAVTLAKAGDMVPKDYRDNPPAIFLAMSKGAELGMGPLASLQNIACINGRATVWGDALPAIIYRAGHRLEEWIEGKGDNMVAHCKLTRGDTGQTIEQTFSVDDAKMAGLWDRRPKVQRRAKGGGTYEAANDSPWYRYPRRMLQMRARSWAVRDGAPDVTMGLHVREEVRDYQGPHRAKDVTPEESGLEKHLREQREQREKAAAARHDLPAAPEPETREEDLEAPEPDPYADADEAETVEDDAYTERLKAEYDPTVESESQEEWVARMKREAREREE